MESLGAFIQLNDNHFVLHSEAENLKGFMDKESEELKDEGIHDITDETKVKKRAREYSNMRDCFIFINKDG